MNSMHNSFSGPSGYSGAYPGYVPPPSALPYYNGYPGDVNQGPNPYYGKPGSSVPPGYSSGMAPYTPPINNSSMYYQQYGLGYQYGYAKYGISSGLGYSSEIPSSSGIHPPSIGTLQAPTTDLGLTGSMFSKNNKFSGSQGSSSPHTSGMNVGHGGNTNLLSPATPNTPSPGPHIVSSNIRGAGATPSPPVDSNEGKKDIDKMKRCQVCGQVFRLMSECLAHMKAVHETPLSIYNLQHSASGHITQSPGLPPHSLGGGLGPPTSRHAGIGTPDSPLMALERMGWGEKQNIIPALQSSSPLAIPYTSASNSQHASSSAQHSHHSVSSGNQSSVSSQVYGAATHQHPFSVQHQSSIIHSPVQHNSPSSHQQSPIRHQSPAPQLPTANIHAGISGQCSTVVSKSNTPESNLPPPAAAISQSELQQQQHHQSSNDDFQVSVKHRKTNSYSVSSIIGETDEILQDSIKVSQGGSEVLQETGHYQSMENKCISDHSIHSISRYTEMSNESLEQTASMSAESKHSEEFDERDDAKCSSKIMQIQTSVSISEAVQATEAVSNQSELSESSKNISDHQDQEQISDVKSSPQSSLSQYEDEVKSNDEAINETRITVKKEFTQSTLIVGKKDLIRELQSSSTKDLGEVRPITGTIKTEVINDLSVNAAVPKEQNTSEYSVPYEEKLSKAPLVEPKEEIKTYVGKCSDSQLQLPEDLSIPCEQPPSVHGNLQPLQSAQQDPYLSSSGPQSQTPQQLPTPISQQAHHHRHPSPPVGMYHGQSNLKQQSGYGGWPVPMGSGYSGQYSYPCPQNSNPSSSMAHQQPPNTVSGNSICSKSHGYSTVHPRFSSQYHQAGPSSGQYPSSHDHHMRVPGPHNYMQGHPQNLPAGHPQGNWFPPRNDSKAMWGSWTNQSGQPYPPGYYGYPNASQPPGQKHPHIHQQPHSAPPPAHVHPPPQSSHIPNMPHQHPLPQVSKSQGHSHFPQVSPQNMTPLHSTHQSSPTQHRQSLPMSPHDFQKESVHSMSAVSSPTPPAINAEAVPQQSVIEQPQTQQPSELTAVSSDQSEKLTDKADYPLAEEIETPEKQHSENVNVAISGQNSNQGGPILHKRAGHKIGPKSKIMAAKQLSQINDLDNYKCIITLQENGYASQGSNGTCGPQSCESSDSEVTIDEGPTFTLLKPAKRKFKNIGRDGIFVGPKRIKLAKQVRERQERRQRNLQEQIRQSELEEQLQAQRIEFAVDQTGPLANILLQSSILLSDKKVEGSDSVEECIANIKAERQQSPFHESFCDGDGNRSFSANFQGSNSPNKKPGRKNQTKVFHNDNSVIIKDTILIQQPLRKLRAKDFKWSHYIKSMRYWCNDCAHGFKNQKEAGMHSEDRCKANCLYMLECYVVVKDIQTHPVYGPKVQELLEEYQVDGQHHCATCSETIARKADYLVHVDSHKDFMPWECTICGTRFKIRGSLKEHLRYTHMKGRVPCLKCNKVFPTSTLLRQHVKVHTQHYKYKSAKNREEELKAAMEATAGALECTVNTTSPEDNEKLSHEANEYRNWCKLMEMNAMKNLSTSGTMGGSSAGGSIGDEDDLDGRDVEGSGDESMGLGGSIGENSCSEPPRNCFMSRNSAEAKSDINS